MHRFFVPAALLASETAELPEAIARQVTRVLRLREGERIVLFCGDGCEVEARLEAVSPTRVQARLGERRRPDVELRCHLHVAVAVLKGEKLDWVVQKLTELGAARISFLNTQRTVVEAAGERWARRLARYQRIAQEAAEQCGRVRLPEVREPSGLQEALGGSEARKFFLAPEGEVSLVRSLAPCPESVLLLVGPEGGFTERELDLARSAAAQPVRLGARILRAETAAIAGAAAVAAAAEQ